MRISDWSSDVCSSDLPDRLLVAAAVREDRVEAPPQRFVEDAMVRNPGLRQRQFQPDRILDPLQGRRVEDAEPHEFLAKLNQAHRRRLGAQSQKVDRPVQFARTRSEKQTSELQSLKQLQKSGFC